VKTQSYQTRHQILVFLKTSNRVESCWAASIPETPLLSLPEISHDTWTNATGTNKSKHQHENTKRKNQNPRRSLRFPWMSSGRRCRRVLANTTARLWPKQNKLADPIFCYSHEILFHKDKSLFDRLSVSLPLSARLLSPEWTLTFHSVLVISHCECCEKCTVRFKTSETAVQLSTI